MVPNLGIFVFSRDFAVWQIWGCWFQIWQQFFKILALKYPNKTFSCNLMREANIWIISCRLIISRGNSSRGFFLTTRYQFAYSGISILLFQKILPGLLRFPTNKSKTLRNHETFHDVASWKEFEKYIKWCEMWLRRLRFKVVETWDNFNLLSKKVL